MLLIGRVKNITSSITEMIIVIEITSSIILNWPLLASLFKVIPQLVAKS